MSYFQAPSPFTDQKASPALHLTWVSPETVPNGFRSYVHPNLDYPVFASGAGNVVELYECETNELILKHETDPSSCWCFAWLQSKRYATGSNDGVIRLWDEGVLAAEY